MRNAIARAARWLWHATRVYGSVDMLRADVYGAVTDAECAGEYDGSIETL